LDNLYLTTTTSQLNSFDNLRQVHTRDTFWRISKRCNTSCRYDI